MAYRKGEFFRAESPLDNGGSAVWLAVTNIAVLPGGTSADIQTNATGGMFVPRTPEQFSYDADGNLATDGHWTYTWDAENRLVKLSANIYGAPVQTIKFEYDWQGRRIHKQLWLNATGSGTATNDVKFFYDGWNLIGELGSSNSVIRTYLWGTDLSATIQGSGGVGGLLAINDATNGVHFAAFDGKGNVSALAKAVDGTASANYEFGPFGELLRATGPMAKANPFRFSTKYQDDETDLTYYGKRYLKTWTGNWLSRDPVGENGGANIYGFAKNDPVSFFDSNGQGIFWSQDAGGTWSYSYFPQGFRQYNPLVLLPGNRGQGYVSLKGFNLLNHPIIYDDFDYRYLQQLQQATDLYPFGNLTAWEIDEAYERGYISIKDYPVLGGSDSHGYVVALDTGQAMTDVFLALLLSGYAEALSSALNHAPGECLCQALGRGGIRNLETLTAEQNTTLLRHIDELGLNAADFHFGSHNVQLDMVGVILGPQSFPADSALRLGGLTWERLTPRAVVAHEAGHLLASRAGVQLPAGTLLNEVQASMIARGLPGLSSVERYQLLRMEVEFARQHGTSLRDLIEQLKKCK
jgi:RHS repeat-associated protein